ncbi:helicase SNF2 [Variovorax dokdonensis]|uniref:Helicase SNF2 n=1 Tax=Variovorax dokdonensis TaxID=344883 RepID=A0ABT7NG36_9BURK|nr:helicase SNF2 [Variovorax dokdonensis]MDM0046883.1 helicase SNF2 [Variovorax dokdonensis]
MTGSIRSNSVRRMLGVSALFLLGAAAAQAETYEGVHSISGAVSRADVQAQAVAAAHDPMWNVPSASRVAPAMPNPTSRSIVQAEAVRAAAEFRSGEVDPSAGGTPAAYSNRSASSNQL